MNKELSKKFAEKLDRSLFAGEKVEIDVFGKKIEFAILTISKMKNFEDDAYVFLINATNEARNTAEGRREFMQLLSLVNTNEINLDDEFLKKLQELKHIQVVPMVMNFSLEQKDAETLAQKYQGMQPMEQETYYTWGEYCNSSLYSTYISFYKIFTKQLGKEFVDEINNEIKDLIKQKWKSEKNNDWPASLEKDFDKSFYKTFKNEIAYYEENQTSDESSI